MFSPVDSSPGSSSMGDTTGRRSSHRIRMVKQSRSLKATELASLAQQKNMVSTIEGNQSCRPAAPCKHLNEKLNSQVFLQGQKNLHRKENHSNISQIKIRISYAIEQDTIKNIKGELLSVSSHSRSALQTKVITSDLARSLKVQDTSNSSARLLRYNSRLKSKMSSRCRSALRTVKVKNNCHGEAGSIKGENKNKRAVSLDISSKPSRLASSRYPSVFTKPLKVFSEIRCKICGEVFSMEYMRKHTVKRHGIQISSYKTEYGVLGTEELKNIIPWDRDGLLQEKKREKRSISPDFSQKPCQSKTSKNPIMFKEPPEVSDDFADFCKAQCKICENVYSLEYMRQHTSKMHSIQISNYKKDYGDLKIIKKVFHKCHICGKLMLWSSDRLDQHIRIHNVTRKEYTAKYCTLQQGNVKPSSNEKSNMEETKRQKAEIIEAKNNMFKAKEATIRRQSSKIRKLKEVSLPLKFNLFKHLPYRFPKDREEPTGENSSDSSEDSSDSSEDSSFSSEDSSDESSDLPSNVNSKFSDVWYDCKVLECSQCEDEKLTK